MVLILSIDQGNDIACVKKEGFRQFDLDLDIGRGLREILDECINLLEIRFVKLGQFGLDEVEGGHGDRFTPRINKFYFSIVFWEGERAMTSGRSYTIVTYDRCG